MRLLEARMIGGTRLATLAAVEAFRQHALESYPEEAVGYLDHAGEYHRLRNASSAPNVSALVPRREWAELLYTGRLAVLCHSHPDGPDAPSEQDMRLQFEVDVPFAIVSTNGQATTEPFAWGDGLRREPLIGRGFRHGVTDCYALIRDWYAERHIELPDFARNWEWWADETPGEKDLYRAHFADAGFVPVVTSDRREGDVWLAAVRSDVPNHAGVYLDGGLTLHHPSSRLPHEPARLSKREPLARWFPFIAMWVRRGD